MPSDRTFCTLAIEVRVTSPTTLANPIPKPIHRCDVVLWSVMLCYVMLCYVILCYVMSCYAMLCYIILCYVMLRYVMLRYVMPCQTVISNIT